MEYKTKNKVPALIMLAMGLGYFIANILIGRLGLADYWMPITLLVIGLIYALNCTDYVINNETIKKTTLFNSEYKSVSDIQFVKANKIGPKTISWEIRFKDGSGYTIDVPRVNSKNANELKKVIERLT